MVRRVLVLDSKEGLERVVPQCGLEVKPAWMSINSKTVFSCLEEEVMMKSLILG